jgi:hypothetical protein
MNIKNIKEMFKKNGEDNNSVVKSNIVINAKDYALENELNKILRNYPILNYINRNLGSIDIKNTLKEVKEIKEVKSKDENVIDDGQNIKNVKILKTLLFKK